MTAFATLTCGSGLLSACTPTRSRPPAGITRTRTSTPRAASPATGAAPLNGYTIKSGGTYSGTYTSADSTVPAITIETHDPVVIDRATITHAGYGIFCQGSPNNVTVTNCTFTALPPSETNPKQYAVYLYGPTQVNIQHNSFNRGHNIFIDGSGYRAGISPIDISYNDFTDTSYYSHAPEPVGSVHGFQINATSGASVMWNRTTNHHGVSISEDVMGFTASNGTAANPILFAHNLVNGSYPDYTGDGSTATGSGHNNGDLGGSYITCQYNTAVRYTNNGLFTPAGTNITIDSCTAICTGYADDGAQCVSTWGWGVMAYNGYPTGPNNTPQYPQGNITVTNNTVGHVRWTKGSNGYYWERADYYFPIQSVTESNNISLPSVTETDVQNAINAFEASVTANGITIGPL
jgi:hypothetical protein